MGIRLLGRSLMGIRLLGEWLMGIRLLVKSRRRSLLRPNPLKEGVENIYDLI